MINLEMISESHRDQLKKIHQSYYFFHDELNRLQSEVQALLNQQMQLSQELENTRKSEKNLINKIEKELDCEITTDDLLKIINS
jgi:predicted  nucleic acid-binding Zn-ribbon protein